MAGTGLRGLLHRPFCAMSFLGCLKLLWTIIIAVSFGRAQTVVQLQGKLVVLNEPRKGSHLVGRPTYHFRLPAPEATSDDEWVLYSLRFAPGVVLPGAGGYLTGDPVLLTVDLDLSGPMPGGSPYQDGSDSSAAASGPPGTLYVKGWSYLPYQYGLGTADSTSAYYKGGSDPLQLRAVVWVVNRVCGMEGAAGADAGAGGAMAVEDVSEIFFGPLRSSSSSSGLPTGQQPGTTSSQSSLPATAASSSSSSSRYPPMTLARLWDACSYGAVRLRRPYIRILNISLPCGGIRANGATWSVAAASEATTAAGAAVAGSGATAAPGGVAGAARRALEEQQQQDWDAAWTAEAAEAEAGEEGAAAAAGAGGCGTNELWGMMEYATNYTRVVLGLDPSPYLRRVLLLPPALLAPASSPAVPAVAAPAAAATSEAAAAAALGAGATAAAAAGGEGGRVALCPGWQQRGSLGCDGSRGCDLWLKADPSRLLEWLTTQLGSSMGLHPAAAPATATAPPPAASATAAAASSAALRWPALDTSCPMGSPEGGYRCFNGPNSLKLLFSQPARRLDRSNTPLAAAIPVQLPAAAAAAANLLLLVPDWPAPSTAATASSLSSSPSSTASTTTTTTASTSTSSMSSLTGTSSSTTASSTSYASSYSSGTALAASTTTTGSSTSLRPLLFVQYRVPLGGDAGLAAHLRRRLVVHSLNASSVDEAVNGGPTGRSPSTRLLAALKPGEWYRDEVARVVVRFLAALPVPAGDDGGVTGGGAWLTVCRYLYDNEAAGDEGCANGLDDDCDGLVDSEDPDCTPAPAGTTSARH